MVEHGVLNQDSVEHAALDFFACVCPLLGNRIAGHPDLRRNCDMTAVVAASFVNWMPARTKKARQVADLAGVFEGSGAGSRPA
jgi:hypothetical protein